MNIPVTKIHVKSSYIKKFVFFFFFLFLFLADMFQNIKRISEGLHVLNQYLFIYIFGRYVPKHQTN